MDALGTDAGGGLTCASVHECHVAAHARDVHLAVGRDVIDPRGLGIRIILYQSFNLLINHASIDPPSRYTYTFKK